MSIMIRSRTRPHRTEFRAHRPSRTETPKCLARCRHRRSAGRRWSSRASDLLLVVLPRGTLNGRIDRIPGADIPNRQETLLGRGVGFATPDSCGGCGLLPSAVRRRLGALDPASQLHLSPAVCRRSPYGFEMGSSSRSVRQPNGQRSRRRHLTSRSPTLWRTGRVTVYLEIFGRVRVITCSDHLAGSSPTRLRPDGNISVNLRRSAPTCRNAPTLPLGDVRGPHPPAARRSIGLNICLGSS